MYHTLLRAATLLTVLGWTIVSQAGVIEEKVSYEVQGTQMQGRLYLPEGATTGTRTPAVIVFHEWWGNNDYAQKRARDIAEAGMVSLAADLYGSGTVSKDRTEAAGLAMPLFKNREVLRARGLGAVGFLRDHPLVQPNSIVVTGYCLGGATSLELARTGAPITAAFSFHGSLNFPDPITTGTKVVPVFILNGKDDPSIPVAAVEKARAEFQAAGFPVTVVQYEGAVHSFTNPAAGNDPKSGGAYNAEADKDSHQRLFQFLRRYLGRSSR